MGISTRGIVPTNKADACHYATVGYSLIHKTLDKMALQQSDNFVDIGCGKGRILCCASRLKLSKIVGVEYSIEMCKAAQNNARRLRGQRTPIDVHWGKAEDFNYSSATAVFMFNPFGAETLKLVLEKIRDDKPNHLRMAFINASPAQKFVLSNFGWHQTEEFSIDGLSANILVRRFDA